MATPQMKVSFWGVCGSIPAPPTPQAIDAMLAEAARTGKVPANPTYYGGNTLCLTCEVGGKILIFDFGTGARRYGQSLFRRIIADKVFEAHAFMSHVHWDHIQGFPFFGPIYLPKRGFKTIMHMRGGVNWKESLETVLRGQMKDPRFPVDFSRIELESMSFDFRTVHDDWSETIGTDGGKPIIVSAKRLNHPNETYGYRVEFDGLAFTFTPDNEGYTRPDPALVHLARGADLWVTECQYTGKQYRGEGCIAHTGWGHSEPDHVSDAAEEARPKRIVTIHHDPDNGPEAIRAIADAIQDRTAIPTSPAREGDTIEIAAASEIDLDPGNTPPPVPNP